MKKGEGGWGHWGQREDCYSVDFHWNAFGPRQRDYGSCMGEVYTTALAALKHAQDEGYKYVLFTHGSSTSRPGQTTARSMIRGLMRSKESTPYVVKKDCVQYETVFVAACKKK